MVTNQPSSVVGPDENAISVSVAGHAFSSESYDQIAPCVRMPIPDGSGGRQLDNVPCGKVILRNASGNAPMFIGGIGQYAVFSGRGATLYANETITLPVVNMNRISVMSSISGQHIECIGFLVGPNVPIDISGIYIRPDDTPPTVVDTFPDSGATGVSLDSRLVAQFSEAMNESTIDTSSFVVRESGQSTILSGTITYFPDTLEATLQPFSGQLQPSKVYRATLATSIQDANGNGLAVSGLWSFTTRSGMFLLSVQPTSGISGVSPESQIAATFSQPIMSGTVTTSAFTVRSGATSTVNLSGIAFVDTDDPTTALLVPYSGIIKVSGTYFVRVGTSITDTEGIPLNQSGVWSYTTQAGPPPPDTTPPRVSGTTPISGASGVDPTSNITVTFSEQVTSGTVNTTNLFVRLSGQAGLAASVSLAADLKTATINPTSNLLNGQMYHIVVLSGVTDLAGNFLSPYLSGKQFTTIPFGVSGTSPTSGATDVYGGDNLTITFSESVQSGTVNSNTIQLKHSGNTQLDTLDSVTLGADLKTVTFVPSLQLTDISNYYINVSGVKNLAGNFMSPTISGLPFITSNNDAEIVYTVADDGNTFTLDGGKFRIGFRVRGSTYVGETMAMMRVYLRKPADSNVPLSGIVSGLQLYIEKNAGGRIPFEYGFQRHVNPALLTGSMEAFDFRNKANSYAFKSGDKVVVEWISGTASGRVRVACVLTNVISHMIYTERTGGTYSGSTYNEYSGRDVAGIMWGGEA